jgi:ABC-type glycerol-3-phosphate transport system substrate-binding protein
MQRAQARPTRRGLMALAGGLAAGGAGGLAVACAAPDGGQPASGAPAPGARRAELRVHLVKKLDVSDWIEQGLQQNLDDWKSRHPNVDVTMELHGAWTDTYFPQVIAISASGQLGDLVWYPPRHRSHLAWGTKYGIVRDLTPLAKADKYDLGQFYKGATEQNTHGGKQYWLSYISEPVVPLVAYNKTRLQQLGVPPPADDWTFDDLAEFARRATTANAFGYYRGDSGAAPFGAAPYLRQWGVEPVDATGTKATFLDRREAFVQALTFRSNLTNTWKVSPNPRDGTIVQNDLYGKEQRILAADVWPFRIQGYPKDYPDFETDFVLTPTVKKGDRRRSMLNEHVFGVTTASKAPEAAFAFLTWIAGKEMNVQGLAQGFKGPIARPDVWADGRIVDRWPAYKKLRPVMEGIEADYLVANFRGEEFDTAASWARLERGEVPVLEAATEIQRLSQEVLSKEPA